MPVTFIIFTTGTCIADMAYCRIRSSYLGSWLSFKISGMEWPVQVYETAIMYYR